MHQSSLDVALPSQDSLQVGYLMPNPHDAQPTQQRFIFEIHLCIKAFLYQWGAADDHSKETLVQPLHHALSTDLNRMIAALSLEPQA